MHARCPTRFERPVWRGALAFVATLSVALAGSAAEESPIRSLNVAHDGTAYTCDVVMFAPVLPAIAWEVLTDFEHMGQWVPNVRMSRVLSAERNAVTVEQHGLAKVGVASFPYATERRVEMTPLTIIRSTQTRGSLRRMESLMTLKAEGAGTRLSYHLEIEPNPLVGVVMSTRLLKRELVEQFGPIVHEMIRRHGNRSDAEKPERL